MSKDLLPLHFAVGQVLSISRYNLENGRMLCKQKYCIKNMAVKILILILSRFSLLADFKFIYFASCLLQLQVVLIAQALVDGFSSFKMVLARFRWLQVILDRFRSFQLVSQMVLAHFRLFWVVLDHFRLFQLVRHFSKYLLYIFFYKILRGFC